jgi:hypothetical protein
MTPLAALALGLLVAAAMLAAGRALVALGRREEQLAPDSLFYRPRF